MSEEINQVHIKTYDEWLKYYKNATKEQVIEDLTRDVQYFADAVKDIKDLQQKVEQLEKENKRLKEWKEDLLSENIELENIRKEVIEQLQTTYNKDYYYKYDNKYLKSEIKNDLLNILNKGSEE